jgi:hypothetical protein
MKRIALLVLASTTTGCLEVLRLQPVFTDPVVALAVTPPPPPAVAVDAQVAAAPSVETAPEVAATDPEEVTAATEPPDPIYEEQTESPGSAYVWVGGYWGWTGSDWGWYGGQWRTPPEGRLYVEPYYERVGDNVVFVRGYWGTHDDAPRSYGGDRIVFSAATRPADYKPGEHAAFERRAGSAPGTRSATAYAHTTGAPRPIPQAKAPSYRTASAAPRGQASTSHDAAKSAAGTTPSRGAPAAKPHAAPAPRAPAPSGRKKK